MFHRRVKSDENYDKVHKRYVYQFDMILIVSQHDVDIPMPRMNVNDLKSNGLSVIIL